MENKHMSKEEDTDMIVKLHVFLVDKGLVII